MAVVFGDFVSVYTHCMGTLMLIHDAPHRNHDFDFWRTKGGASIHAHTLYV